MTKWSSSSYLSIRIHRENEYVTEEDDNLTQNDVQNEVV